jgi:23S rRNA (cytosine1962-C5)-methyltransferase
MPSTSSGSPLPRLKLAPGREKSLRRRHPWIFSGAVAEIDGVPAAGSTVRIVDQHGHTHALAAWNAASNIRARVWTWNAEEPVDADFFRRRIAAALSRRAPLAPGTAGRLVNAESDGLPGLTIDRYGDVVVVQISSAGSAYWRNAILDAVEELTDARAVYEKSDSDVLALEGLAAQVGVARGQLVSPIVEFIEHGLRLSADLEHGHKTGYYLDQAENRQIVGQRCAGRDVLNAFCYTGGFGLQALASGARSLVSVDSSASALARAKLHVDMNELSMADCTWIEADVFKYLRLARDQARQFDVIVLDPPKFAPTVATAERAARGYKDINLWALRLLRPGGLLATFSCSGGVSTDLFRKIVAGAAQDAEVDAQILQSFHAAPDHPLALAFPEGEYLKGLLLQIA